MASMLFHHHDLGLRRSTLRAPRALRTAVESVRQELIRPDATLDASDLAIHRAELLGERQLLQIVRPHALRDVSRRVAACRTHLGTCDLGTDGHVFGRAEVPLVNAP